MAASVHRGKPLKKSTGNPGEITNTELNIAWHRHLKLFTTAADAMRRDEVFTDVVLVCGNREFAAHRLILAGASPYFRAMLDCPMVEASSGKILLNDLDPDAVEVLLSFIYTGNIKDMEDDNELMKAVLEASHMLLMDSLFNYIISTMQKALSSDHFIDLWNTSEFYNQEEIVERIKQKIACYDFKAASCSKDFLKLTLLQVREILALANPSFADITVKAVLEWTRADETNRLDVLPSLLQVLKLSLLTENYLKQLLSSEPLVQKNQEAFRLLVSVSLDSFQWRCSAKGSRLLCFAKNSTSPRVSNMYIKEKNVWSTPVLLPFTLTRHMSVLGYKGIVYFIGCKNAGNREKLTKVWQYTPNSNTCTLLTLTKPVSAAAAVDFLD